MKKISTIQELEEYLKGKRVYVKKEVVSAEMKTIVSEGAVITLDNLRIYQIRPDCFCFNFTFENTGVNLYEYGNESFFIKKILGQFFLFDLIVKSFFDKSNH